MSGTITLKGVLEVGGECVAACGGGSDTDRRTLSLRCPSTFFQGVVLTGIPLRVSTPGVLGASFVDLDLLADFVRVDFLYAKGDQPFVLRLYAASATLTGVGGTFPTLFGGGETLNVTIDGVAVAVVFQAGDQTAAQCAARINAACALAGLATPRAVVLTSGQLQITGVLTGSAGEVEVTSGTGAATLGLAGSASGTGQDVQVFGTFLAEFDPANAPQRVQVSGSVNLSIVAAGRTIV